MNWLKSILDKLFNKNKPKLLESSKIEKKDFISELKRQTNPEADMRNGYKIAPIYKLKDMV